MSTINYNALGELFVPKSTTGRSRNAPLAYKRFERAAEAIRFALEEVAPERLASTYLEVEDERFDGKAIRALYNRADFPLPRRAPNPA